MDVVIIDLKNAAKALQLVFDPSRPARPVAQSRRPAVSGISDALPDGAMLRISCISSIGKGKTMVEFFSVPMLARVDR